MRLVVSKEAMADFHRLHDFLADKEPRAAQRAIAALRAAISSLEVFPGRGRPSGIAGIRELVVPFGTSAYVVRYAYLPGRDSLVVLRLWHSREERA